MSKYNSINHTNEKTEAFYCLKNNYDKETYKKISLVLILFTLFVWVYLSYITWYSFTSKIFHNEIINMTENKLLRIYFKLN